MHPGTNRHWGSQLCCHPSCHWKCALALALATCIWLVQNGRQPVPNPTVPVSLLQAASSGARAEAAGRRSRHVTLAN